jgi:hypothetical protein
MALCAGKSRIVGPSIRLKGEAGASGVVHLAADLEALRRHCRREHMEDLLDDLAVLCEDVQDGRDRGERRNGTTLRVLR